MRKVGWRFLLAAALVLPLAGQEPTAEDLQDLQRTLEQPIQAAKVRLSRRSVLTLSPGLLGIREGATTWQAWPSSLSWRWRP